MISGFGIATVRCISSFIRPCRRAASSAITRSAAEVKRTFQARLAQEHSKTPK